VQVRIPTIARTSGADGFFYTKWDYEGHPRADTEADARAKVLIYLLENGLYRV